MRAPLPLILALFVLAASGCPSSGQQEQTTRSAAEPQSEPTPALGGRPAVTPASPSSGAEEDSSTPSASEGPATTPAPVVVQPVVVEPVVVGQRSTTRKDGLKRWLGLSVSNMEEPIPGAPPSARSMIQRAHRGGPGHAAGLQRGDVIVRANGVPVALYQDYTAQARLKEIGESIHIEVLRDGRPLEVDVTLVAKPPNMKRWRKANFPGTDAFEWDLPSLRPAGGRQQDAIEQSTPQLIYFWATWCGPCRQTSPLVEDLHVAARGRVQVVTVSSEERSVIEGFLTKGGTTYPVAQDELGLMKMDYEVASLPTIVWLEGDKVVAWDYGVGGVQRVVARMRRELKI